MQHPVSLPCAVEAREPLLRQHRLCGSGQSPPLGVHLQGEVCVVQKMCACWGTKSLSLGLRGGAAGRGSSSPGVSPVRWGKRKPALEGLGWDHCLGAYGRWGSLAKKPVWAGEGAAPAGGGQAWWRAGEEAQERVLTGGRSHSGNPLCQDLLSGSHSCSHLPLSLSRPSSHFLFPLP